MRGERGSIFPLLAAMLVVLTGGLVLAVDVGRLYLGRAELQAGCDAGALEGVKLLPYEEAEDKALIESFVKANVSSQDNLTVEVEPDGTAGFQLTCCRPIAMTFLRALKLGLPEAVAAGLDDSPTVCSEAQAGLGRPSDIVLALDVSNSMGGAKIENLKTCATEFVRAVIAGGSDVRVAIVPFIGKVRMPVFVPDGAGGEALDPDIPAAAPDLVAPVQAAYDSGELVYPSTGGQTWSGFSGDWTQDQVFQAIFNNTLTQSPFTGADCTDGEGDSVFIDHSGTESEFSSMLWWPCYKWCHEKCGIQWSNTGALCPAACLGGDYLSLCPNPNPPAPPACAQDLFALPTLLPAWNSYHYLHTGAHYNGNHKGCIFYKPNSNSCEAKWDDIFVRPLSGDLSTVESLIAGLDAGGDSNTDITEGVKFATYMLTPECGWLDDANGYQGLPNNKEWDFFCNVNPDSDTQRYMILMTDVDNHAGPRDAQRGREGRDYAHGGHHCCSEKNPYPQWYDFREDGTLPTPFPDGESPVPGLPDQNPVGVTEDMVQLQNVPPGFYNIEGKWLDDYMLNLADDAKNDGITIIGVGIKRDTGWCATGKPDFCLLKKMTSSDPNDDCYEDNENDWVYCVDLDNVTETCAALIEIALRIRWRLTE